MPSAIHEVTLAVTPEEAPRNGALSGRDLFDHLPTEDVETPIGVVHIHGLGALDMIELQGRARNADGEQDNVLLMLDMVARGLDVSREDIGRQSFLVIKPLYEAVLRLSGLTKEAVDEAVADLKETPSGES